MSMDGCISALATAVGTELKGKQDVLVSGTDIKTVNGTSLLGSGNLVIAGGGGTTYTAGNAIDLTGDIVAVTAACDTKWSTDTIGSNAICVITENLNTGYGTSHRAENPVNYGDIGYNAIDLSYSNNASTTAGATGEYSVASGYTTCACGHSSFAGGYYTYAKGACSIAFGEYTSANAGSAVALGRNLEVNGFMSGALANNSTINGTASYSIGSRSNSSAEFAITVGSFLCNTKQYGILVGTCGSICSMSNKVFAVANGTSYDGVSDSGIIFSTNQDGSVCIVDGTQGAGKVLTSDANGKTCWATPSVGGGTQNVFIQEATPTVNVGASALWICKGTDGTITFNLVEG